MGLTAKLVGTLVISVVATVGVFLSPFSIGDEPDRDDRWNEVMNPENTWVYGGDPYAMNGPDFYEDSLAPSNECLLNERLCIRLGQKLVDLEEALESGNQNTWESVFHGDTESEEFTLYSRVFANLTRFQPAYSKLYLDDLQPTYSSLPRYKGTLHVEICIGSRPCPKTQAEFDTEWVISDKDIALTTFDNAEQTEESPLRPTPWEESNLNVAFQHGAMVAADRESQFEPSEYSGVVDDTVERIRQHAFQNTGPAKMIYLADTNTFNSWYTGGWKTTEDEKAFIVPSYAERPSGDGGRTDIWSVVVNVEAITDASEMIRILSHQMTHATFLKGKHFDLNDWPDFIPSNRTWLYEGLAENVIHGSRFLHEPQITRRYVDGNDITEGVEFELNHAPGANDGVRGVSQLAVYYLKEVFDDSFRGFYEAVIVDDVSVDDAAEEHFGLGETEMWVEVAVYLDRQVFSLL